MQDQELLSRENLLAILERFGDEVFVVNKKLEIIYVNRATQKYGLTGNSASNPTIFEAFPQLKKENSNIVKVFANGEPICNKLCNYVTGRGERKVTLNCTYPLFHDGEVVGVFETVKDISGVSLESEKYIVAHGQDAVEEKPLPNDFYTVDSIIGKSPAIAALKDKIIKIAGSPSNVLIYGETGTGKELVAQAIHSIRRRSAPGARFIAQNCAAIPESLLESILFGTEKGSYTGAESRPGLFELAGGGILFLDEINSMPIGLQAKLLRALQEGRVRRVGGREEIPLSFRLITSTNVRPELLVEAGEMRSDLYYRLNVVNIELPLLKDRREDIPLLVHHFIGRYNKTFHKSIMGVDEKLMAFFLEYDWPGNVRELQNFIERQFNSCSGPLITRDEMDFTPYWKIERFHDTPYVEMQREERVRLNEALREVEIELIKKALRRFGGNVSKTARELDIPQQTLNNKLTKYGIKEYARSLRQI